MFHGEFRRDLDAIVGALQKGRPFALIRFGDGEEAICRGRPYRSADTWRVGHKTWLREPLLASLSANLEGFCIGGGSPCCLPSAAHLFREKIRAPWSRRTFGTIFYYGNYNAAREGLSAVPHVYVASQGGDHTVPEDATSRNWGLDALVESLLAEEKPIYVAAGPLANIIIHRYWTRQKASRRQPIVDVGSLFDERHKGKTRRHMTPGSPRSEHQCAWSPKPMPVKRDKPSPIVIRRKPAKNTRSRGTSRPRKMQSTRRDDPKPQGSHTRSTVTVESSNGSHVHHIALSRGCVAMVATAGTSCASPVAQNRNFARHSDKPSKTVIPPAQRKSPFPRARILYGDLVVVSIAVWNTPGETLSRAVESILQQTYPNLRVVVTSDGEAVPSWNGCAFVQDERVTCQRVSERKGPYFAHETVLRSVSAPLFAVQDADDWSDPARIALLVRALVDRDADAAVPTVVEHDGQKTRRHCSVTKRSARMSHRCDHFWVARSDSLQALGGYHAGVLCGTDTLLSCLLTDFGSVVAAPGAVYHREKRERSLTQSKETGFGSKTRQQARAHLDKLYRLFLHRGLTVGRNEMRRRADCDGVEKVAEKLRAILPSGLRRAQAPSTRIGVVSVANPKQGLWRDTQSLLWALLTELPSTGQPRVDVSVFAGKFEHGADEGTRSSPVRVADLLHDIDEKKANRARVFVGDFKTFAEDLDVVVFFEKVHPKLYDHLLRLRKRVVFVPNLDWATLGGTKGVAAWLDYLRSRTTVEIWARQLSIGRRLRELFRGSEHRIRDVTWSIPDVVRRDVPVRRDRQVRLFVNAGNGGFNGRRAVERVIQAFQMAKIRDSRLHLVIKTIRPIADYVAPGVSLRGVSVLEGFYSRERLAALMREVDAVVHVSHWEGFGYAILEALHAGLPVITHTGWPVGDLVEDRHNGLRIAAHRRGMMHLAVNWDTRRGALADAMVKIADDALRRRLTTPQPSELIARQKAFCLQSRCYLTESPIPRVVVLVPGARPHRDRRSEYYWGDALRATGLEVDYVSWHDVGPRDFDRQPEFVLGGKVPADILSNIREMTEAPLVIWHHDHHSTVAVRGWLGRVLKTADLYVEPEITRGQAKRLYLLPGPRSNGDRGPGQRPTFYQANRSRDVVFLGNRCESRDKLLRELTIPVETFGDGQKNPRALDDAADAIYRSSKIALSLSLSHVTPGYTSNRLFHAAANGTCVVAHGFPAADKAVPDGVVIVKDVRSLEPRVRQLLQSGDWEKFALRTEESLWRHHTWGDRVEPLLARIWNLKEKNR